MPKYLTLGKKMTDCICPKCGREHKKQMIWIGRGVCRKYCEVCKATQELSPELVYETPKYRLNA